MYYFQLHASKRIYQQSYIQNSKKFLKEWHEDQLKSSEKKKYTLHIEKQIKAEKGEP